MWTAILQSKKNSTPEEESKINAAIAGVAWQGIVGTSVPNIENTHDFSAFKSLAELGFGELLRRPLYSYAAPEHARGIDGSAIAFVLTTTGYARLSDSKNAFLFGDAPHRNRIVEPNSELFIKDSPNDLVCRAEGELLVHELILHTLLPELGRTDGNVIFNDRVVRYARIARSGKKVFASSSFSVEGCIVAGQETCGGDVCEKEFRHFRFPIADSKNIEPEEQFAFLSAEFTGHKDAVDGERFLVVSRNLAIDLMGQFKDKVRLDPVYPYDSEMASRLIGFEDGLRQAGISWR